MEESELKGGGVIELQGWPPWSLSEEKATVLGSTSPAAAEVSRRNRGTDLEVVPGYR